MVRFSFGTNWRDYIKNLSDNQISQATQSLQKMLNKSTLEGSSFLDIGCGSGLFSLSAFLLKADKITSFDYDIKSVECTKALHQKYGQPSKWNIFRGDVLEKDWLTTLGQADIVYSWGVLHHTGQLWNALDNVTLTVKPGGILFISIYNDQGIISKIWTKIKYIYNISPFPLKWLMAASWFMVVISNRVIQGVRFRQPFTEWFKGSERGMNLWHDTVDWIGGYPFETAKPNDLIEFFNKKNFDAVSSKIKKGSGCNELIFRKRLL